MRRTWISAAAAAGFTTVAAAGFAAAQEKQPGQEQAPAARQMEDGQGQTPAQGQMEKGVRGAEAQRPIERATPEAGKTAMQTRESAEGKAAQSEQRNDKQRANTAQSERLNRQQIGKAAQPENRAGSEAQSQQGAQTDREMNKTAEGARSETQAGEAQRTEKGNAAQERTGQAQKPENHAGEPKTGLAAQPAPQGGTALSSQNEMRQASEMRQTTGQATMPAGSNANGGGNVTATGNADISNERASRIADTLMATAAPQNINIDVSVGVVLPGEADVRPLPSAVVALVPEYRGYDYVVVHDEIVIVEPSTRRVVEIIRQGHAPQAMEGRHTAPIALTEAQQRLLFETVRRERIPEANVHEELTEGAPVPPDVTLEPVPQPVLAQIPTIERYRLFLADNRVVLVDPDTHEVVDVIR